MAVDSDFDATFQEKLNKAVKRACEGADDVAVELSGGFDSSCVALALNHNQQKFEGFAHVDETDSGQAQLRRVQDLLNACPTGRLGKIDLSQFDPIAAFDHVSKCFNGAPPYIFVNFAEPLFKAVQKSGHKILLSGFGGDECVTSHAKSWPRQLALEKQYKHLWQELGYKGSLKTRCSRFLRAVWPELHEKLRNPSPFLAIASPDFDSIKQQEFELIHGEHAEHVKLRISSSEVMAKEFGFEYRYPLLDPELIEWCLNLPLEQKVRMGVGRQIARRFLIKHMGEPWVSEASKKAGIFSGAMAIFKEHYEAGSYDHLLKPLERPQANWSDHRVMVEKILAYQAEVGNTHISETIPT